MSKALWNYAKPGQVFNEVVWLAVSLGLTLLLSLFLLGRGFLHKTIDIHVYDTCLYPPLSGLGPEEISEITHEPAVTTIVFFCSIVQTLVFLTLIFVAYKWGLRRRND